MHVFIFAVVGMLIGWITNFIAIKLLFRPLKPIRIFIFELEGVIPRRKREVARVIGQTIEEKLLSSDELVRMLLSEEHRDRIIVFFLKEVHTILQRKVPSYLPITFKENVTHALYSLVQREIHLYLDDLSNKKLEDFKDLISFREIIEKKINAFSIEELETITYSIMRKELRHIELFGGLLGLLIGFTQGMLATYL